MVEEVIYTSGNHTKTGEKLVLRRRTRKEAKRLYMAWSNPQAFRYNDIPRVDMNDDVEWECVGNIEDYGFPSEWGMYYMAIYRINENGEELIGNCRFGKCPYDMYINQDGVWDFGFSIIRADDKLEYTDEEIYRAFLSENEEKEQGISARIDDNVYWGNGYITEVIATILEVARQNGIRKVVSGADIHNFGSSKAQVKCGMKFSRFDEDIDPEFEINLDKNVPLIFPSKEEVEKEWNRILEKEIYPVLNNEANKMEWERQRIAKLNKALARNKERREFRTKKNNIKR